MERLSPHRLENERHRSVRCLSKVVRPHEFWIRRAKPVAGEITCRQLVRLADEAKANHFLTARRAPSQDVAAQLGRQGLKLEDVGLLVHNHVHRSTNSLSAFPSRLLGTRQSGLGQFVPGAARQFRARSRRSAGSGPRPEAAVRWVRLPSPSWLDVNGEKGWKAACPLGDHVALKPDIRFKTESGRERTVGFEAKGARKRTPVPSYDQRCWRRCRRKRWFYGTGWPSQRPLVEELTSRTRLRPFSPTAFTRFSDRQQPSERSCVTKPR